MVKILYEDSNILAIDKPSGIAVHSDGRSKERTITDWILKNYPKLKNVGEDSPSREGLSSPRIERSGIVHRLDKETSGVLLIMKTKKAFAYFKKQFMDRKIKKTYHAIVSGFVKNDYGIINKPIGRSPKDFRRHLAGRGVRGETREAITQYKVLKRFTLDPSDLKVTSPSQGRKNTNSPPAKGECPKDEGVKFTYLEIKPKTGRTHQIRVHMKFINCPVACDSLYNPKGFCPKGLKRLALHAKSMEFKDPRGKTIRIESPLPPEFKKACPTLNF